MGKKPSSSVSVNKDQHPLLDGQVHHEERKTTKKADMASPSGTKSAMADNIGIANEREEERSLWRENVEHRLRIAKERLTYSETNDFRILKVPEYHRQPPEMFAPAGWRFGLHNLDSVDRDSGSEALKLCVPLMFGLDEEQKWEKFCDYVVRDSTRMLGCYGLHKEDINMKEEEIKEVLAFDALFIAWAIDMFRVEMGKKIIWTGEHVTFLCEEAHNTLDSDYKMWSVTFGHDLWRLENQIPFELIKRAMQYIIRLKRPFSEFDRLENRVNGTEEQLEMWMMEVVLGELAWVVDCGMNAQEMSDLRLSGSHHILDAAYKFICGKEGLERRPNWVQESFIHIPSAIQLKHAGVKIEGIAKPLCNMSYNKKSKSLILPKMKIYDGTIAFIRNMARYEATMKVKNNMYFDYISLMLDLITTNEDMDYLSKCGVIDNFCGSRAFEMLQLLNRGLTVVNSSKEHNAMKEDIKRRYDLKLPKLWREFRTLFCSRPWLIVPLIAATLVTIATLIQTYTAVTGSDRMKPRYKNP